MKTLRILATFLLLLLLLGCGKRVTPKELLAEIKPGTDPAELIAKYGYPYSTNYRDDFVVLNFSFTGMSDVPSAIRGASVYTKDGKVHKAEPITGSTSLPKAIRPEHAPAQ